jgi:hypothetical protein
MMWELKRVMNNQSMNTLESRILPASAVESVNAL